MAHEWSKRLVRLVRDRGWSIAELARRANLPEDRVRKYVSGKVQFPRGDTLSDLAKALEVSPLFLLFGQAAMPARDNHGLRRVPVMKLSTLRNYLGSSEDTAFLDDTEGTIAIPDQVGARAGAVVLDDESMLPLFPAGTTVVYDPDLPPAPGRYVVAVSLQTNSALFRRWRSTSPDPSTGVLVPINKDYPEIPLGGPGDGFVVGRAVMVVSRI